MRNVHGRAAPLQDARGGRQGAGVNRIENQSAEKIEGIGERSVPNASTESSADDKMSLAAAPRSEASPSRFARWMSGSSDFGLADALCLQLEPELTITDAIAIR